MRKNHLIANELLCLSIYKYDKNQSVQYHVIEQTRVLPTFSMFAKVSTNEIEEPKGFVTFTINERIQRVCLNKKILKSKFY